MQFPDGQPQLCEHCKKRPATAKYTYADVSEMVCAACLDRREVQDAYENRCLHIHDLEFREQYDEALACLAEILEVNRLRDHDKWLARSIARDRAMILFDAGRYAEAEQACKAWDELGITDAGERWMYGSVAARTLDVLGRPREGLEILEEALSHQDPKDVPGAWSYLRDLVGLSERLGQPVDPKWRSLAEETAASHGVEMPKHEELGKAILELAEAILKVPPKYNPSVNEELARLDKDLEANRHRTDEEGLAKARRIASFRVSTLFEAGRYAEAEQACQVWAELGFADAWERWDHALETVRTLEALGRPREALAVLEEALGHQDPRYVRSAWECLEALAEISEKLGQPVDPKWGSLAQEVAAAHGLEMPEHEELGKAIVELAKTIEKVRPRRWWEEVPGDDGDEP
jgi:tetratricopeptide (TPR) repeat protein